MRNFFLAVEEDEEEFTVGRVAGLYHQDEKKFMSMMIISIMLAFVIIICVSLLL